MSITPENKLIPSAEPEDQMAKIFPSLKSTPSLRHRSFNIVNTLILMLGFVGVFGPPISTPSAWEIWVHSESLLISGSPVAPDIINSGSVRLPFSIFEKNHLGDKGPSCQSSPRTR